MFPRSLLSRVVLIGACGAATAGWLGVRVGGDSAITASPATSTTALIAAVAPISPQASGATAGAASNPALTVAQPGVRDRSAWQPSPIPSQAKTSAGAPSAAQSAPQPASQAAPPATQATSAEALAAQRRAAWQPSPIPSKPSTASGSTAGAGAAGSGVVPLPNAATVTSAIQAPSAGGPDSSAAVPALPQPPVAAVPALGGAVAAPAPALSVPSTGAQASTAAAPAPAAPAAVPYTPMSAMLSSDQVAEMFGGALPATRGEWVEQHFYSAALGREDAYMVWLPPGYSADTNSRYPSLYLLHGVGGPEGNGVEEWLGYALTEDLDRMMALGLIEPMIVILPNGEQGYWMNHSPDTDGTMWADFVAKDLVKDVDAHFRTDARRERRGIGGLSMGGHGALQIAMNHPDEFSVVGAHSPTIRPFETSPEFFGDQQWFARYDPITLAEKTDAASKLAIWIDAGNEDPWLPMTEELDSILEAKKDNVQMHVLEGAHEGWYWEYYLPEYLNFYSSALTATATTPKGAPMAPSRSLLASAGVVTRTSS